MNATTKKMDYIDQYTAALSAVPESMPVVSSLEYTSRVLSLIHI